MAIGIIAEFNPFHNGHMYLINEAKRMYPDDEIVVVLGGNILQRGNLSIIEKYDKTKVALNNKVDVVVELPFSYSSEASDFFAEGSIKILNYLKVDKLIFGSEEGNLDMFYKCADVQINNKDYDHLVKTYLDEGNNYPTSMNLALKKLIGIEIDKPNDLLALSYIKEIIKNNYNITPVTIKRTNDYHSKELEDISSASSIREAIKNNKNVSKFIPKEEIKYIIKDNDYFKLLKYKIISTKDLSIYASVDEGLDKRIKDAINKSNTIEELIDNIKTKRYTYNRITRMLTYILFEYTKEDSKNKNINYIRILGFSSKGKEYINKIKKEIEIPLITNITKNNYELIKEDLHKDEIYYNIINKSVNVLETKPIIIK
jgi:predicted nucleotidyltransferase